MEVKTLDIAYNASGAVRAAKRGDVVMVVDVIDMSTTAEAVLDGGALSVWGASPDNTSAPVVVNPAQIGYRAGQKAVKEDTEVILITEPRFGSKTERTANNQFVLVGINRSRARLGAVLPNIGTEITEFTDFANKVVVIASQTGGVAFDAAYNGGATKVVTGTIVRTKYKKGAQPLEDSAKRAMEVAQKYNKGLTLVASSSNSYEDILATQKIAETIVDLGFLNTQ